MLSIQHLLLATTVSPTLQGVPKDGFGEDVVALTCPNRASFRRFFTVARRRLLWTYKEADLTPHPVVGLVLPVGDAEKFPQVLGFESLDPFQIHVSGQR